MATRTLLPALAALAALTVGCQGPARPDSPTSRGAASPAPDRPAPTDSASAAGGLHASIGPRGIVVRFPDESELVFRHGQIVAWRSGSDVNHADAAGLGPWPVPLHEAWERRTDAPVGFDDPAHFAGWGSRIEARQSLDEASAARVVISAARRYREPAGDGGTVAAAGYAQHSWRYAIYADGRVYLSVASDSRDRPWAADRVGYALALNARAGLAVGDSAASGKPRDAAAWVVLCDQHERARLLWAPFRPELGRRRMELLADDPARHAVLLGDQPAAPRVSAAHLLILGAGLLRDARMPDTLARDYQQPAQLHFDVGGVRAGVNGDVNSDGFNEAEGTYELQPDGGLVRVRIDPAGILRRGLRLRLHDVNGRAVAASIEGRVLSGAAYDEAGETALLLLPDALDQPARLELHLGGRRATRAWP